MQLGSDSNGCDSDGDNDEDSESKGGWVNDDGTPSSSSRSPRKVAALPPVASLENRRHSFGIVADLSNYLSGMFVQRRQVRRSSRRARLLGLLRARDADGAQ